MDAAPKDWSKPILRYTREGWRWAIDLRFPDGGALKGAIAYVGPYVTAAEAMVEQAREWS